MEKALNLSDRIIAYMVSNRILTTRMGTLPNNYKKMRIIIRQRGPYLVERQMRFRHRGNSFLLPNKLLCKVFHPNFWLGDCHRFLLLLNSHLFCFPCLLYPSISKTDERTRKRRANSSSLVWLLFP